jgi:TPP-dependent pyruvate/acetoin dehydrogenase alpha subunit
MDPQTLAAWKDRDPLALMRRALGDDAKARAIEEQVEAELEAAVTFAKESPEPSVAEFLSGIPD